MSRFSISACGKFLATGLVLMAAATLATVLFNFLGTISCSALVGMMAGATRQWRWRIIAVSLIFPAVIMGYLVVGKTDLPLPKTIVLAGACLGAFWLTYVGTLTLLRLEQPTSQGDTTDKPAFQPVEQASAAGPCGGVSAVFPPTLATLPGLEELQGTWLQEVKNRDGRTCKKLIEVRQDQLVVSVVACNGQVCQLAKAGLKLGRLGPFNLLLLHQLDADPELGAASPTDLPADCICRLPGGTLTLAEYLEANGCAHHRTLEAFVKIPGTAKLG